MGPWASGRLTEITTSHGGHDVSVTEVTTSHARTSRRLTEVTTSHGRQHVTEVTTSHGDHDVSRRSQRLTEVTMSRRLADVTTFHGSHDVSWRSRRLTEVKTSYGGHNVPRGRHDVSRRSRRLTDVTDVTTSDGGHDVTDVSWRSRRLHCLVLVGASFTEQSGHLQVPASRRHDQGCVLSAPPCPCRRQLHRAVGPH